MNQPFTALATLFPGTPRDNLGALTRLVTSRAQSRLRSNHTERDGPHRHQILISNAANVASVQRHQSLSFARGPDELDVQAVRLIEFDDRPKVTLAKSAFGMSRSRTTVSNSRNLIGHLLDRLSRTAGSPRRFSQSKPSSPWLPARMVPQDTIDLVFLPKVTHLALHGDGRSSELQYVHLKPLPTLPGITHPAKKSGLKPSDGCSVERRSSRSFSGWMSARSAAGRFIAVSPCSPCGAVFPHHPRNGRPSLGY